MKNLIGKFMVGAFSILAVSSSCSRKPATKETQMIFKDEVEQINFDGLEYDGYTNQMTKNVIYSSYRNKNSMINPNNNELIEGELVDFGLSEEVRNIANTNIMAPRYAYRFDKLGAISVSFDEFSLGYITKDTEVGYSYDLYSKTNQIINRVVPLNNYLLRANINITLSEMVDEYILNFNNMKSFHDLNLEIDNTTISTTIEVTNVQLPFEGPLNYVVQNRNDYNLYALSLYEIVYNPIVKDRNIENYLNGTVGFKFIGTYYYLEYRLNIGIGVYGYSYDENMNSKLYLNDVQSSENVIYL